VFAPISSGIPLPPDIEGRLVWAPGTAAGEFSAEPYDSRRSLQSRLSVPHVLKLVCPNAYLSDSFFPGVFLRLGVGILQSMEKATQFVHGTPRLAASHRTCGKSEYGCNIYFDVGRIAPFSRDMSEELLAGFVNIGRNRLLTSQARDARCLVGGQHSLSPAVIHIHAPPKTRMPRTLLFRDVAGSVGRAEARRRAHVGNGPRVVHTGGRCTRYAWLRRVATRWMCSEETAGDSRSKQSMSRPRRPDQTKGGTSGRE
jgi:hypothetical protein